ncbi:hypothetical protein PENARI_c011G11976 [Penicillium arizonense]|uniref:Uncharacterized protein n=1 Tax=Penicillium arizonense TaxID=1835702 RepID=A0A1F5LFN4_PENAI|nr:hypothetical protein PENARI_c011G11976 [Penicillium arizonense]OGE52024.1 hypothetical protein PENARI_c011G11976 [Penicillium arizonense]
MSSDITQPAMDSALRPKAIKVAKLENLLKGIGYPYHNESTKLEIGNGVMELCIGNWKSEWPTFDLHKTDDARPQGGFQLKVTDQDMVVTFVIKGNYPFGMDGLCDNLADMFQMPEDLGMSDFIVGKAAVTKTMKTKKKGTEKWSTPFTTFGCRVNWMTSNDDPDLLRYKFLPTKPLDQDEQIIVNINKGNVNFLGVAQSNLTEYGEAMAVPIRIWLCTKWMAEKSGGADNNLFGKMSTTDIPKTARSINPRKLEHTSSEEPEGQGQRPEVVDRQAAMDESVSDLDSSAEKSNERLMAELTFGDGGDTAIDAYTPGLALRGDSLLGVQNQESSPTALTERRLAIVGNLTVTVPQLSLTPTALTTTMTSSYETARSHLSPPASSPDSPLSPFRTTPSGREEADEGEVCEESEELASPGDQPILTSPTTEVACELRYPVSGKDELCFSDPEDYTNYRAVVVAVDFPREESTDAVRLGLFEGPQKITRSSFPADFTLSLDLIEGGSTADEEQSAKAGVRVHVQDPVCSESSSLPMTVKTSQEKEKYNSYRLGHMSGTDSSSGNGGEGHHSSPLAGITKEVGSPTAEQEGDNLISEVCRPRTLAKAVFPCALEGCRVLCSLTDEMSVVCPKCGPYSSVRYCGKEHLWDDAIVHWEHCGGYSLPYQCLAGPLPEEILVGPPMVPSFHGWDSPERHRQALWFSSATNQGDYFVFADSVLNQLRSIGTPKDRFRRLMAICLFGGVEYRGLVGVLFRFIRGWMKFHRVWDRMEGNILVDQLEREMGVFIPTSHICQHNVRENEWTGADQCPFDESTHRHCVPPQQRLQEDLEGGRGLEGLCNDLESTCWILRAHRTTHPTIRSVVARVRGDGFEGVLPWDRRGWRRGEGWDGFGNPAEW